MHPCSEFSCQVIIMHIKAVIIINFGMTQEFMFYHYFIYSLWHSNISDAGAQALAEGLQHCSNLQMLE